MFFLPSDALQDDSEAFGRICACAARLCCGLAELCFTQVESEAVLERAIDAGLVRTIIRSLRCAALRGAFHDLSLGRQHSALSLLAALLDTSSGRACAEFVADEAALGHLVEAIRAGASAAPLTLGRLLRFTESGGTKSLRSCGIAARHGAPAALTRALFVFLGDRSLSSDDLRVAMVGGADALSWLHISGSLGPEEAARARVSLSSAQKQLAPRKARAAASGDTELLGHLARVLETLDAALTVFATPPYTVARLAKRAKEADATAAKALAAHNRDMKKLRAHPAGDKAAA